MEKKDGFRRLIQAVLLETTYIDSQARLKRTISRQDHLSEASGFGVWSYATDYLIRQEAKKEAENFKNQIKGVFEGLFPGSDVQVKSLDEVGEYINKSKLH